MASTYSSNSGIELIRTGEQSGTWGDTTNLNLQIIDRLTNGVGAITLSGTTHTLSTTDGTLSDGQYAVLVFGGTPSGTNTVTVSPDDQQKIFIVKNNSGQTVVLTQGSGGNVTVLDGDSKIVYCDGAGASAEVVDVTGTFAFSDVNIDGGSIDGVTLGTNAAVTEAQIDNINIDGNAITSTNSNGNIAITPNGTGEVDISKVDINGGTIDGTVIGGSTPAAGGFTNITVTGTVDGRDVSVDGAKLDGIEAGADVTDTTNVTAAGALMDSELTNIAAVKALDQGVATTDSPTFGTVTAAQYDSTEALPDIKPSLNLDFANVKKLDPRITYTRASTATYYDGKTFAKAEENLLLRSQDYSTSWTVTNLTPVTGKTAPDGTSTATEFTAGAANAVLTQGYTAVAADYTFSVWLRRVTGTGDIQIAADNGTWNTETITGTWARYDVTQTVAAGSRTSGIRIVTSGDAIEVWGAQLEQRSALTDYTATTTQPITNYIPALQTAASGEARFDHDPITGESKGFLIQEQRTNLVTYSEQFDNAAWSKVRSSITANIVVAPDGTLTGDKLVEDTTADNTHICQQTVTLASGNAYAFSVYVKAAERELTRLLIQGTPFGGAAQSADFNLVTQVATVSGGGSASIVAVGNGWLKCTLVTISATTTNAVNAQIYVGSGSVTYTGDGYSGIYVWGASLEQGSFPTSYIKTEASQVTRSADAASMTGTNFSSWYRQDEGTVFFKSTYNSPLTNQYSYTISNGTGTNRLEQLLVSATSLRSRVVYDGASVANLNVSPISSNLPVASAFAYQAGSQAASYNGAAPSTASAAVVLSDLNFINIGSDPGFTANRYFNGHIKKLAYYPKRLSNQTLQALTEE